MTYNGYASYGNKLTSVSDAAAYGGGYTPTGTFSYDANGNLISNGQKHFSYNSLNLLSNVSYYDNYMYFYDAEGRKLRKQTDNVIDYGMFDDIRYYNNGIETYWSYSQIDRLLDLIHHDEGVIRVSYGSDYKPVYTYEYFLKDHLGNTRVAFKRGTGETAIALQRSDYYPFGLRQTPYNPESDNKYLYNGKEIQDETGWYDYGARMYDPTLGRFHTPDPLAEEFSHTTIYDYAGNNPISYIDYNGEHPVIIIGGAAIGLIEFGLFATGVISTGWILSRSYQGDISFKSDLFARSRKARNKNKTRNHRQSHSTNRPKRFNPKRTPEGAAAGAAAGMTWSALDFYINHRSTIHPGDYEFKIENYHEFYDVNLNDHFIQRDNFFSPEESNTSKIISPERDPSRIDPERIKPGQVEPLPRPVIVPEPEEPELPRQDPLPIPPPSAL